MCAQSCAAGVKSMDLVRSPKPIAAGRAEPKRLLVVGPLGQGVGLLVDALALAAEHAGWDIATTDCMLPALRRGTCASLVRLGEPAGGPSKPADLLLAFGLPGALEAQRLLAARGTGLALVEQSLWQRRRRFLSGADSLVLDRRIRCWPAGSSNTSALSRIWTMLGWVSGRLELPLEAWRRALNGSLPRRLNLAAQLAFDQGRTIGHRASRF